MLKSATHSNAIPEPKGMTESSSAGGFLDFREALEMKETKQSGGAAGFLDFVDEDEAIELERKLKEEEKWISMTLDKLVESVQVLENVVTCMEPSANNWVFYCQSLLVLFKGQDAATALIRFWIDTEVRATNKSSTLFREDSIRIQGIAHYMLATMREWIRDKLYRPILKKLVAGNVSNAARGGVSLIEGVSLSIVRAMNEGIQDLPAELIRVLTVMASGVSARFPAIQGEQAACNFLFLRVITPMLVNPSHSNIVNEEISDRATLVLLARIGKTVQKWVNSYAEESELLIMSVNSAGGFFSSSKSVENLHAIAASNDIADSSVKKKKISNTEMADLIRAAEGASPHLSSSSGAADTSSLSGEDGSFRSPRVLSSGEQEVLKFVSSVFKVDGVIASNRRPDAYEVSDARAVIKGLLKKHYNVLRELETCFDRSQTLEKHFGSSGSKIFGKLSRMGSSGELMAQATRLFVAHEAILIPASRAEAQVGQLFSDFSNAGHTYTMAGARHIFIYAQSWSIFSNLRFVSHQGGLYESMVYAMMRSLGADAAMGLQPDTDSEDDQLWIKWLLTLFPHLALSGRGRAVLGVNAVFTRSKDFLLTIRLEGSSDAEGAKKSGACQCFALLGWMTGWCSAACGRKIHGAELQCVAAGDKLCHFLLCDESQLEGTAKKMAGDLKSKHARTWLQSWDQEPTAAPSTPGKKDDSSSSLRTSSKRLSRKSESLLSIVIPHSLDDVLGIVRSSYGREQGPMHHQSSIGKDKLTLFRRGASRKQKRADKAEKDSDSSASDPRKFMAPESRPETGGIFLKGGHRVVLYRAQDFSTGILKAAHTLIPPTSYKCLQCNGRIRGQARKCPSCDAPFYRRMASLPAQKIRMLQGLTSSLLYAFGLANGEALGTAYLEDIMSMNFSAQLDLFANAFASCGWGEVSFSSFCSDADEDCSVICHVQDSFEASNRLGSLSDAGCPTCSASAGMIAGFLSIVFDQRCACVETECSGSGTSGSPGKCSFVASFPSLIARRVKMYLAAAQHEEYLADLNAGLGVEVFSSKEESSQAPMSPLVALGSTGKIH